MTKKTIISALATFLLASGTAFAHENQVELSRNNGQICITSNGLPNHDTGTFPNSGNPHSIEEQTVGYCVTDNPTKGKNATNIERGAVGISFTGIPFRPETADYYDASSPRGHSRDSSSGWNLEGMGSADMLGMDQNNAHVDIRGLYHYHGKPVGLLETTDKTMIGYAADGFEIHYVGDNAKSGWSLKNGSRSTAPGGTYDGSFVEDWEYTSAGNLDKCNGATLDGKFVYFATDTYPFYPRCFWGEIGADFIRR